jgi:hypothetical protein
MTVRRLPALLLALCLGASSSFALACGEDREGLITSTRASDLQASLDKIDEYVAAGRCDAVDANIAALRRDINDLPGTVDRDLRRRLREGLERLESQAPEECEAGTKTTETEPETTPETVPPETIPPETVPPETAPTETTPPTTPPQTAPPATTPPATPPDEAPEPAIPDESGGEQAPSGAVQEETG